MKRKGCNATAPMDVQGGVQPVGNGGGGEVEMGVEVESAANGVPTGMDNPHAAAQHVRKF